MRLSTTPNLSVQIFYSLERIFCLKGLATYLGLGAFMPRRFKMDTAEVSAAQHTVPCSLHRWPCARLPVTRPQRHRRRAAVVVRVSLLAA